MHNSKNDIESIKGACHSLSFDQLLVWVKDSLKKLNFKDSLEIIKMASEKLENPSQLKLFSDAFHQIPQDKLGQHLKYSAKVAVGGNSNNKILADTIAANMIREGIVPNIYELSFDQWVQELMNPESGFYGFNPSFLVLYLSNMGLKKAGAKKYDPDDLLKVIDRVVEEVKGRLNLQIIMVLPEPMEEELTIVGKFYLERHRFNERLISKYENDLIFIDPSTILAHMGAEKWFAPRYWYTAKFPFHPAGIFPLSRQISAAIARSLYQKIKVIVCDLDDFLWGGIVGEDGLHGLDLDANEVGGNYIRLQKYLLSLREQGMILVIASKNNEEDVRAVFENREEMVLKWEDFACHRINWKPKSQNIGEIAQELNLSIDSFCFLDDSPHEREEVRFSLPEVVVPEIPDHPEEVVPFLVKSLLFYMPRILREDAKRSEYYLQEKKRKGLKEQFSHLEDYLKSLEMSLEPQPVDESNFQRTIQLINKTNQFNMTTRRYDSETVKKFINRENSFTFCYRLKDKLGDSGIIAVLFAFPSEGDSGEYFIDTWLMSCRVMGRDVEKAMFKHLIDWLNMRGVRRILGKFLPTKKNIPVKELYRELGFNWINNENDIEDYSYDCEKGFPDLNYLAIKG